MLILEIGPGRDPKAHKIWQGEGVVVETVEADTKFNTTYHFDASEPPVNLRGRYDAVYASHVFEHIPYNMASKVLKNWRDLLKVGGELHIIVPSGEWSAIQLLSGKPSKVLQAQLHGARTSVWDIHHATYTMRNLRAMFQLAGFGVIGARTTEYHISVNGELFPAEQHYIVGVKQPVIDPSAKEPEE